MQENKILIEQLLRVNNILNEVSKKPKDFGTGDLLFSSEIHTITAIKDNPDINLTKLSLCLGISKSATSKFVNKLIKKEYLIKTKHQNNKKEILLNLTSKGISAALGHEIYSKNIFKTIFSELNELNEKDISVISNFLENTYSNLNKINSSERVNNHEK